VGRRTGVLCGVLAASVAACAFALPGGARVDDARLTPESPLLPAATVGREWNQRFQITINGAPWTYGMYGCSLALRDRPDLAQYEFDDCKNLPPGLSFSSVQGCTNTDNGCAFLHGVPTRAGSYRFRIAASNGDGGFVIREYTLVVGAAFPDLEARIDGPLKIAWRARSGDSDVHWPEPQYHVLVRNEGAAEADDVKVTISFQETDGSKLKLTAYTPLRDRCPHRAVAASIACTAGDLPPGRGWDATVTLDVEHLSRDERAAFLRKLDALQVVVVARTSAHELELANNRARRTVRVVGR
jgi:hypothetical protein